MDNIIFGLCSNDSVKYLRLREWIAKEDLVLTETETEVIENINQLILKHYACIQQLTSGYFCEINKDSVICIEMHAKGLKNLLSVYLDYSLLEFMRKKLFQSLYVCELIEKQCSIWREVQAVD